MLNKLKKHKRKIELILGALLVNSFVLAKNVDNLIRSGKDNIFKDLVAILAMVAVNLKWVILIASLLIYGFSIFKHLSQREADVSGAIVGICQLLIILAITFNIENFVVMIYGVTI